MNLTKHCFIFLLFSMAIPLFGQNNESPERPFEFGLLPMKVEWSSETLYFVGGLKKPIGFYLNANLQENGLDWTGSLTFTKTSVFESCRRWCAPEPYGNMELIEVAITSGLGYTLLNKIKFPIKPYVQMEGHYSYINYSGDLKASRDNPFLIIERNSHYHLLGTITKVGAKAILFNRVSLSVLSGFRWGMGFFVNQFADPRSGFHLGYAVSPVEVRCGVRF